MMTPVECITPVVNFEFKPSQKLKSSLCHYSDTYRHVKVTINYYNYKSQTEEQQESQIIETKMQYFKIVLHLLIA